MSIKTLTPRHTLIRDSLPEVEPGEEVEEFVATTVTDKTLLSAMIKPPSNASPRYAADIQLMIQEAAKGVGLTLQDALVAYSDAIKKAVKDSGSPDHSIRTKAAGQFLDAIGATGAGAALGERSRAQKHLDTEQEELKRNQSTGRIIELSEAMSPEDAVRSFMRHVQASQAGVDIEEIPKNLDVSGYESILVETAVGSEAVDPSESTSVSSGVRYRPKSRVKISRERSAVLEEFDSAPDSAEYEPLVRVEMNIEEIEPGGVRII